MNVHAGLFGVLAINKPQGQTSRDIVNKIQKLIRPTKVGHTGTLDPLATGVLLLALGRATRLVEFAHLQPKSYEADFLLGRTSTTLDTDGEVQELPNSAVIDQLAWQTEMQRWCGRIRQTPPQYSACRVQGRRAYDLARQGVEVELTSREVDIYQLELIKFSYPLVCMRVQCSSGTYIRSLGHDIASALGSAAVMSRLIRTDIGPFAQADCRDIQQLTSLSEVEQAICSPVGLVDQLPRFEVSRDECQRLRSGLTLQFTAERALIIDHWRSGFQKNHAHSTEPISELLALPPIAALDSQGELVAMLSIQSQRLQPTRVFL